MICGSGRDHAAHFFRSEPDDALPDIARARRSHRHRRIGEAIVSIEIIQVIRRPKRDDIETDFPAIAFRSARQSPVTDPVDVPSRKRTAPDSREA